MSNHRLGGTDSQVVGVFAETGLDRLCLVAVVRRSRGTVGVDIVYLFGAQIGFLQGSAHSPYQSLAAGGGFGDVVRIIGRGVANQFRLDVRSPRFSKVQVFQDQHTRSDRKST